MMIKGTWEWQDLDSLSPTIRSKTLSEIQHLIINHPDATMEHDLEWLYAKCGVEKSVRAFVCYAADGVLIGYAPFFVHPSALSFELLSLTLYDYRIRRLTIASTPLIAPDHASPDIFQSLFIKLLGSLDRRDALFGLGVPLSSQFSQFLQHNHSLRKEYLFFPHGMPYFRRFILLPKSFDEYLKNLSHGTRKQIRRAMRNLENDADLSASFRAYTLPEEISTYLALAQTVSDKTYQKALLGLGVSNNSETHQTLALAAKKGWLRSYILTCKHKPVAFQQGYLHNGTYYAELTGYDPSWADKSVGTVMQIYRIHDLIQLGVTKLDFLYGDNEKKKSLSNFAREEQNFYIIPRRFPISVIAQILRIFNFTTKQLGNFMEKYGLKSKIRRFLRKRATNN